MGGDQFWLYNIETFNNIVFENCLKYAKKHKIL